MKTCSRILAFIAIFGTASPSIAQQSWPVKPVRLISQVAAGTVTDIVARMFAEQMGKSLGQPWIVENRPGGEGMISLEAAARSASDGYAFIIASQTIVINPLVMKSMSVDPKRDLTPVATIVDTAAFAIVANAALPAKNLEGVIVLAKGQPGKISYGVTVPISGMFGKWLGRRAAIDLLEVPYKTTQQLLQDTMTGEVSMCITSLPGISELVQAGKVRVLAVSSPVRLRGWESVPTIAETFSDFSMNAWVVLLAPRGTPADILQRANRASDPIVKDSEFQKRLSQWGWFTLQGARTVQGTADFIGVEGQRWGEVIQRIGLQPQ
ncbi:MAG: tripartite tricarboxylate transporter substrate binding protein [Betaproteobacteria bacterium]|nr:tripartite tricarboxylate transporter substrate binding protein [Betaproteobacteria bacterium]